jgi:hypothetical protein
MGLLNSPPLTEQPECAVGGLTDHVVRCPSDLVGNRGIRDLKRF